MARLWSAASKAKIDNIVFAEDYCDPVPSSAQGMFKNNKQATSLIEYIY